MQIQDALLDGISCDQAVDDDRPFLADSVGAVGGLGFDGRVPPGIQQEDVVGGSEVEPCAAISKGEEHDVFTALRLVAVDDLSTIARRPVESKPRNAAFAQTRLDVIEQTRPLRKNECLVSVRNGFFETCVEGLEFRR